jgi:hypothetical protein
VYISSRPSDEGHVNGERPVPQPLFATKGHQFDEFFVRALIQASTILTRIDERTDADPRQQSTAPAGDLFVAPSSASSFSFSSEAYEGHTQND